MTDHKRPTWANPVWYRGFRIYYDSTPVAGNDWHYVHDDYDGAEDAGDNRAGSETTLEACKIEIDERFFDGVLATTPPEGPADTGETT
jgi:hypothetical protein